MPGSNGSPASSAASCSGPARREQRLGGGVGGPRVGLARRRRGALVLVIAGTGRRRGLADPVADAVDQFLPQADSAWPMSGMSQSSLGSLAAM